MADAPAEKLLSEKELATRWGVTPRTIKNRRAKGDVPAHMAIGKKGGFGQGVMYRLDDVIAYENSKKVPDAN